jgi:hypothetical protein
MGLKKIWCRYFLPRFNRIDPIAWDFLFVDRRTDIKRGILDFFNRNLLNMLIFNYACTTRYLSQSYARLFTLLALRSVCCDYSLRPLLIWNNLWVAEWLFMIFRIGNFTKMCFYIPVVIKNLTRKHTYMLFDEQNSVAAML